MRTRYIPQKNDSNVKLTFINEIANFLIKEGYYLLSVSDYEIALNKGSENSAKSFIDYKFDLFRDIKFEYEVTGLNDCIVYISRN
jgi:hypothetical protein